MAAPKRINQRAKPGCAYQYGPSCSAAVGKWILAVSPTHFLTGPDGLCRLFETEAEAKQVWANRKAGR